MLLEVCLVRIQHAVEPWKKLLGAMVSVQDHRDAVGRSNSSDIFGGRDGACNGSFLVAILDSLQQFLLGPVDDLSRRPSHRGATNLAREICSSSLGSLEDDGSAGIPSGFQSRDHGRGRGHVLEEAMVSEIDGGHGMYLRWRGWHSCCPEHA